MKVHRRIVPHGCGSARYVMNLSVCWGQKVLRGGAYGKSLKPSTQKIKERDEHPNDTSFHSSTVHSFR